MDVYISHSHLTEIALVLPVNLDMTSRVDILTQDKFILSSRPFDGSRHH